MTPRIIFSCRLFLDRIDRINRMIYSCFLSGYPVCCLNLIGIFINHFREFDMFMILFSREFLSAGIRSIRVIRVLDFFMNESYGLIALQRLFYFDDLVRIHVAESDLLDRAIGKTAGAAEARAGVGGIFVTPSENGQSDQLQ